MGSKIWLIAVLLLAVSVGLEAFPVARHDYSIDFESDDLLQDLAEGDGLREDDYELDYPYVEDDDDAAAAIDDDDGVNGNELEVSRGALDEMGLEDPLWGQTLRLPRPRDRHPRSPRPKQKKKKGSKKRPKGKKKKAKSKKRPNGRRPRKGGCRKSSGQKGRNTTQIRGGRRLLLQPLLRKCG